MVKSPQFYEDNEVKIVNVGMYLNMSIFPGEKCNCWKAANNTTAEHEKRCSDNPIEGGDARSIIDTRIASFCTLEALKRPQTVIPKEKKINTFKDKKFGEICIHQPLLVFI